MSVHGDSQAIGQRCRSGLQPGGLELKVKTKVKTSVETKAENCPALAIVCLMMQQERELAFIMLKIVIQNPSSETIINNVYPEELEFWRNLLDGAVQGDIKVFNIDNGEEYQVA